MKRSFFLLPMLLPKLSDHAAVQLLDILAQLMAGVQHFYAPQCQRWHRTHRHVRPPPPTSPPPPLDEPF